MYAYTQQIDWLGVFSLRYLEIVKSEGFEISQPALDPNSTEIHHKFTIRARTKKFHRWTEWCLKLLLRIYISDLFCLNETYFWNADECMTWEAVWSVQISVRGHLALGMSFELVHWRCLFFGLLLSFLSSVGYLPLWAKLAWINNCLFLLKFHLWRCTYTIILASSFVIFTRWWWRVRRCF